MISWVTRRLRRDRMGHRGQGPSQTRTRASFREELEREGRRRAMLSRIGAHSLAGRVATEAGRVAVSAERRDGGAVGQKLSAANAPGALRRALLRAIDRDGPQTAAELPRLWPVTRQHVKDTLHDLIADGLVRVIAGAGVCRVYGLTELGRRHLEEIDWAEAVAVEARGNEVPGR